ncbi:MAG: ABC transporter ATP-binding protein/permease [Gammaproteobacteria bacterium]|nr:ABC transporter ATP-binding protein/permease [Gammaproteobacteria bacterium]
MYNPYRFYLLRNSADLSKNILVECTALAEGIILPAMQGLAKLVSVVLICLLLIVVNPILAGLVGLTFGGSYLGVYLAFYRRLGEFGKKRLAASTQRFKITGEAFGGVKEVKAKGHESHFTRRFAVAAKSFAQMVVRNQMITQLPRYLLETVAFGGLLMITLYLILTQPNFSKVMSLLALYALAGYRLMPSLQQLYLSITTIRFNKPIVDVVYADLKDAEDLTAQSDSLSVKSMPFARSIDLQQLSFTYEGAEQSAINNFNLSIPKGANIAFVGHTGAGKTTIVDLILGLLTPTTGQISVDGKVLTANNRQAWQQIIGYIPQEIFLCDGTVAENIAFGTSKSKIDLAQVQRVAKVANLHDFVVNDLPLGYETVVGEKGVRLSGGQRQRIGIARAIYDNPDILVLDEATSALDGITEEAVLQAIHALSKQKTLITIAHRLATVKSCDQIYLLEAGNIVDQGSYQELIARNKTFKAMAREQTQQETIS